MTVKRIHILYSGRVQGVGFRFTAESFALELGICGWVKNLPDGTVEIECEGDEDKLKDFLARINVTFGEYIKKSDLEWFKATGEFKKFEIRFY